MGTRGLGHRFCWWVPGCCCWTRGSVFVLTYNRLSFIKLVVM